MVRSPRLAMDRMLAGSLRNNGHGSCWARKAWVGVLLLLTSCVSEKTDVKGSDRRALFTDARMTWIFAGKPEKPPEGQTAKPPGTQGSLNLQFSHAAANDSQDLSGGQVIVLGGQSFGPGPPIHIDYSLSRLLLDARVRTPSRVGVFFEAFAGLEWNSMSVELRQAATSADDRATSLGPAFGAALLWQPVDHLRFSAEGRAGFGVSSSVDGVTTQALDLLVSVFPEKTLSGFLGWRTMKYEASSEEWFHSGLDLSLSGPVIGLSIRF